MCLPVVWMSFKLLHVQCYIRKMIASPLTPSLHTRPTWDGKQRQGRTSNPIQHSPPKMDFHPRGTGSNPWNVSWGSAELGSFFPGIPISGHRGILTAWVRIYMVEDEFRDNLWIRHTINLEIASMQCWGGQRCHFSPLCTRTRRIKRIF